MVKVFVDNKEVLVPFNSSVLEACETVGIEIPRFCYHERLLVAGNCRMCLVEIEKAPKPIASCAMPVANNMKIFTGSPLVKKAREGVLEFLLVNHPLDCPICDQGGECDLQDQVFLFGSDRSRFYEYKRSVSDKNCGPLIKTIMTRCIHCTRCVRFALEVAGVEDLGTTNRGRETEIGTYVQKVFQSELSGNVIDLCPVGALTSKPYSFSSRPWELKTVDSIDITDGVGSNIRVDFKETEVVRVLPRLNDDINEEWLSDKARFSFDGLKSQRLDNLYLSDSKFLHSLNWVDAQKKISKLLKSYSSNEITVMCGSSVDLETLSALKLLGDNIGISNVGVDYNQVSSTNFSSGCNLNMSIASIMDSDFCVLVGTNPRLEASLFNTRLRKRSRLGNFKVVNFGTPYDLTYSTSSFGVGLNSLIQLSEGNHPLCKELKKAKRPVILYGAGLLSRNDSFSVQQVLNQLSTNVNIICEPESMNFSLHTNTYSSMNLSSENTANFLTNLPNQSGSAFLSLPKISKKSLKNSKFLFMVGVSENSWVWEWLERNKRLSKISGVNNSIKSLIPVLEPLKLVNKYNADNSHNLFSVYQNFSGHSSLNPAYVNLILPTLSSLEKDSTFLNMEGRAQKTGKALSGPGFSKGDKEIASLFFSIMRSSTKYFGGQEELYSKIFVRDDFTSLNNNFLNDLKLDIIEQNSFHNFFLLSCINNGSYNSDGSSFCFYNSPLSAIVNDFYMTDSACFSSLTMAKCSQNFRNSFKNYIS
jgi:NADH-quinone oxidoreductase chain G